jgi:hypothetical protein
MRTIITDGTKPIENIDKNDQIIIVCDDTQMFTPDEVAKILDMKARMVSAPEGGTVFYLGILAGQYSNKPENVVILTENEKIQAAAQKFGFSIATGETVKKVPVKRARRKKADPIPAPTADNVQAPVENKPSTAKKKIEDVPDSAISYNFVKIARECGVGDDDLNKVYESVKAASEAEITYELQLRLHLLDAAKAADIYGKTKAKFDDLKKAAV